MATTHRKDLTKADFDIVKEFKRGLIALTGYNTPDGGRVPYKIEQVWQTMWRTWKELPRVPTWYEDMRGEWKFSALKEAKEIYQVITKRHFRNICNYIHYTEGEVLHVLYRFALIAVHGSPRQVLRRWDLSAKFGPDFADCYLLELKRLSKSGTIANRKRGAEVQG